MRYLVTGAEGVFGAHCAKQLLDQGNEVISIRHDTKPVSTASLLNIEDKITWAEGSLLNETFVKRVVAVYGVHSIIHFAALPLVQTATRSITPVFQTNLMGTIHLLEAIKENAWAGKAIRFIYISTDKVYGDAGERAYTEDLPLNALAPYECSKAAADLAVQMYAKSGYIPSAAIIRPCNIIAAGDLNFGRVLPRMIVPCVRGDGPVLYKTDYLREFIAVEDAVKAILRLDRCLEINNGVFHGQAFNVGSGEQRSLVQVVETVLQYFPKINPRWIEAPPISRLEIPFQMLSTEKLRNMTGWETETSFEVAVHNLIFWWKENWNRLPEGLKEHKVQDWHG